MSTVRAAMEAARRGWAVFPCRPGDKRPAVERWEQRACADPETVGRFWPSARHNVGVACGPSRLVVVDLDTPAHGGRLSAAWAARAGVRDGSDVLAWLAEDAGQTWPWTWTVRTPSGGTHLYFQAPRGVEIRNSAGKVGPMVDVRGVGGYVVGAGSAVGGRPYEVTLDLDAAELPAWLAALARGTPRNTPAPPAAVSGATPYPRLRGLIEIVLRSEPGTRNGRLYWASRRAGELVAAGKVERAAAEQALISAAVEAGLRGGEREARNTVMSGMRAGS